MSLDIIIDDTYSSAVYSPPPDARLATGQIIDNPASSWTRLSNATRWHNGTAHRSNARMDSIRFKFPLPDYNQLYQFTICTLSELVLALTDSCTDGLLDDDHGLFSVGYKIRGVDINDTVSPSELLAKGLSSSQSPPHSIV